MNRSEINQYDYIQIISIHRNFSQKDVFPGKRLPEIGDIAAVIEIYDKLELGYELECVNRDGETDWLITVKNSDLEFKKINPPERK